METEPAVSEPIHENRWLPLDAILVIAFDALLVAIFLQKPVGNNDPEAIMPVYWTALEILNEACGALALATIVCILSRRLRAIRLAVVFQRWTSITLLITLAIRGNSPATDGDGIAWLIILPITTLFVILGFVASRYLNSASQRLAREPADKNLIPVDSNP